MPYLTGSIMCWQDGVDKRVSVFLSDVETDTWAAGDIQHIVHQTARVVVTKGEKGADEYRSDGKYEIPPSTIPKAVDTNGAGDTFATVYMIALMRGDANPGATASWAASRAVLQPQTCKPQCAPALIPEGIKAITEGERLKIALSPLLHNVLTAHRAHLNSLMNVEWFRTLVRLIGLQTNWAAQSTE